VLTKLLFSGLPIQNTTFPTVTICPEGYIQQNVTEIINSLFKKWQDEAIANGECDVRFHFIAIDLYI